VLPGPSISDAEYQKSREEGVMKCSNPDCNRGIGLLAHRRGWSGKELFCSTICRDAPAADRLTRSKPTSSAGTYFDWLFIQPVGEPKAKLMPAAVHIKRR
jgi:hypothetical protein